jgi:hypothetical protein
MMVIVIVMVLIMVVVIKCDRSVTVVLKCYQWCLTGPQAHRSPRASNFSSLYGGDVNSDCHGDNNGGGN